MTDFVFNTNKPADRDKINELAGVVRSNKSAFDAFMQQSYYWGISSQSAGVARISHNTPGTWRAFYGPRSEVSNPERPGTAMLVSDESRLLVFSSTSSHCMGSSRVVFGQPYAGWGFTTSDQILIDSGSVAAGGAGSDAVSFNTTYGAKPHVLVQVVMSPQGNASSIEAHYSANAHAITTTGFTIDVDDTSGAGASDCTVFWRSEGTKVVVT